MVTPDKKAIFVTGNRGNCHAISTTATLANINETMNGKIKIENLLKGKNPLPDYMLLIVSQIKIWYADAVYSPDEAEVILNNINQTIDELKFTVRNDVKSGNKINRTLDYKGLDSILTVYSLTGRTPVLAVKFEKTTEKPTEIFNFL